MATPNGSVLGYGQVSGIAPNIFMDAGTAIAASIRRTGQEVAKNVERIYTNKQVQAFGQEVQGVNPNSPDFVPSLLGIASKYPMAMKDERGQMIISMLGQQHRGYLAEQNAAADFGRAQALEGTRQGNRLAIMGAEEEARGRRLIETSNGMFDPVTRTIISGTEPAAKSSVINIGGSGYDRSTGEWLTPPPKTMTEYQRQQLADARTWRSQQSQDRQATGAIRSAGMDIQRINENLESLDKDAAVLRRTISQLGDSDPERSAAIARLRDTEMSQDQLRRQLQQAPAPPSMLGGINPAPLDVMTTDDPLQAPVEAQGVLPTLQQLPAPQTKSRSQSYLQSKGLQ